jgi:hypothetical protein
MEWVIFSLVIIFFFYRVIKANFESRLRDANNELQEYYDSLAEDAEADDLMSDYERVQHVRDKFND